MPDYTIESTYHLPVFRHRTYSAQTAAQACRLAIEDDDWEGEKLDHDSAGETFTSGIWEGVDAAYSRASTPVPSQFEETDQRKAKHFEILLSLLKMLLADTAARRASSPEWIKRAAWEITRGEAIIAGRRDPDHPPGGDTAG